MERQMIKETIEQKVFRTFTAAFSDENDVEIPNFEDSINDSNFARVCQAVEILIAEEREACKVACVEVKDKFANRPISRENTLRASGARACMIAIAGRDSAPKDEVSE